MSNPTTYYTVGGIDLSGIFQPLSLGTQYPNATGYEISDGRDLNQIFANISSGSSIGYDTGYNVGTTDLSHIFAKLDKRTWTFTTSNVSGGWPEGGISMSSDGKTIGAVVYSGLIYISTNYGSTFTSSNYNYTWESIAVSYDGTRMAAVQRDTTSKIWVSSNSGVTWTAMFGTNQFWLNISCNQDASILLACDNSGYLYKSTNSGSNFTQLTSSGSRLWYYCCMSANGTLMAAVVKPGYIYISSNSGTNWTEVTSVGSRNWNCISCSSDGTKIIATNNITTVISTDSGSSWIVRNPTTGCQGCAVSKDGNVFFVTESSSGLYKSINNGSSWENIKPNSPGYICTCNQDGTYVSAAENLGTIVTGHFS